MPSPACTPDSLLLNASQTAALLPYPALAEEIARVLLDDSVQVPPRLVQALPGGGKDRLGSSGQPKVRGPALPRQGLRPRTRYP